MGVQAVGADRGPAEESLVVHGGSRFVGRLVWLVPVVVFVAFAAAVLYVTWHQVGLHRSLLTRHTEDVSLQASRRLSIFVDSRLTVAEVFAQRWSTHGEGDFSQRRFEEFGRVIVDAMPGTRALGLVPIAGGPAWVVPSDAELSAARFGAEFDRVRAAARSSGGTVLSAPVRQGAGSSLLFAASPLRRDEEQLGCLVVKFEADMLIDECIARRIREEFSFEIHDDGGLVYRYAPDDQASSLAEEGLAVVQRFGVRNRTWSMTMAPRPAQAEASGWGSASLVLVLGLLLSLGFASAAYVALRRAHLLMRARDRAFAEISAREDVQRALRESERRYRSVFDSATDGLVVMEPSGVIVEANEAACRMHGFEPGELVGRPYPELIVPDKRFLWEELQEQLEVAGKVRIESKHVTSTGGVVVLDVHGTTFSHGADPRVLVILTDVTELRRSEQLHAALSRKVLVAQEEERARIARELHDELGQIVTAIRLELGWVERRYSGDGGASDGVDLSTVKPLVEKAAEDLRHICRGLRPPLLDDLGLEPALRLLVEEFEGHAGVAVDLEISLDEDGAEPPMEACLATYRIVQESLTNVSRHAEARRVSVFVVQRPEDLVTRVQDDGGGFVMEELDARASSGVVGMQERARLVGGEVQIRSAKFQGTRIELRIPLGGKIPASEAS